MHQEMVTVSGYASFTTGGAWSARIEFADLVLPIGNFSSKQEATVALTEKISGFIELCKFRNSKGVLQ